MQVNCSLLSLFKVLFIFKIISACNFFFFFFNVVFKNIFQYADVLVKINGLGTLKSCINQLQGKATAE